MTLCLRWNERRARYRPAGEVFDTSRAAVHTIDEATAKAFVTRHHYSGTYPAARLRAGLFVKPAFGAEQLAGVTVFSVPMTQTIIPRYFDGLEPNSGVELGRLVLLDQIPANAESWFVARAFRLLRQELPNVGGVLSYSDPVARTTDAGQVVKPGHVGVVYQALNATYRGRSRAKTMILAPDGRVLSDRTISKLRNDECGAGYAYQQMLTMGAPKRLPLEDGHAYVARALSQFRRARHPGNHAYTWWIGDRRKAPPAPAFPYPKKEAA